MPAPPRAAPQPALMTNTGMRILRLESAVRDIDAFAERHRNLGSDVDDLVRQRHLRLISRLDPAEPARLDAAQRQRRTKIKPVDD